MAWLRWHEGTSTDPKFHLIARRSGQPLAYCLAVWAMLLERASAAEERGVIEGFDCESADAAMGMPEGAAQAIYDAMLSKGMICGGRIAKWKERQPAREDGGSTQRSREHRERQKAQKENGDATQCNAAQRNATQCNAAQRNATQCNAAQRNATPDKIRVEEIREEKINPPTPPLGEGGGSQASPISPGEKTEPPKTDVAPPEEPGIEFLELREYYSANLRAEGPMAGYAEYKALKGARDRTGHSRWPGLSRLMDDIDKRREAGVWNRGYEIGLARYLAERTWEAPIPERANPQGATRQRTFDDEEEERWERYMTKVRERQARRERGEAI